MPGKGDSWNPAKHTVHEGLSSTSPWWLTFMGLSRRILSSYFSGNKSGTCYRVCLFPQTICVSWLWHPQLLRLQRTLLPSSGSGDHGSVPLQRLVVTCMFLSSVPLSRSLWVLPTLAAGRHLSQVKTPPSLTSIATAQLQKRTATKVWDIFRQASLLFCDSWLWRSCPSCDHKTVILGCSFLSFTCCNAILTVKRIIGLRPFKRDL